MPDMDGIETTKQIKNLKDSKNTKTPVIILTANAITGVREEYIKMGFSDYLSKPVKSAELEEMILRYLPKEKINPSDKNKQTSSYGINETDTIEYHIKEFIPEIDWRMGILYCAGDKQLYIDMLKDFSNNDRIEKINKAFKNNDWNEYRIQAHSLKSSSLMVGFSKLSEQFKKLEFAVKENNISYIRENHQNIVENYNSVISILKKEL
jgi:response regulator RpfG family c-di-GMP phosphodiesterase